MKYLSEGSNAALTSVADWKPINHERFAELLQLYATFCSADAPGDHGNEGMAGVWCQAYRHDRQTTATIWYMPANGKAPHGVSSPVLLVLGSPGKTVCFEHLSYGLERPTADERMRHPSLEEWKAKGKQPLVRTRPTSTANVKGEDQLSAVYTHDGQTGSTTDSAIGRVEMVANWARDLILARGGELRGAILFSPCKQAEAAA